MAKSAYWLKNVLLEKGFQYENEHVISTETEKCHLFIEEGIISNIVSDNTPIEDNHPQKDANGLLALPTFVEKHCHLDKTILGDSWRAVTPAKSILERFEIEKRNLPLLPTSMKDRAKVLVETILRNGSTHIRTHVDIYPEVGLRNLEVIKEVLSEYESKISYEIVAFPQHGLLRSNSENLIREAIKNGATLVGGVDPATVDENMDASLYKMMEIAVEGNADIDLHLHDPGQIGITTIKKLAKLVEEARWLDRVSISHAFALGDMEGPEADEMVKILSELGITIISSIPLGRTIPTINFLHDNNVAIAAGCDNIFDSWSPFGNGDILERAGRLAERFGRVTEQKLSETLGFITNGVTPLNKQGQRIWPAIGTPANIVFVEASCSAEVVGRRAKRKAVFFNGVLVSGTLTTNA